MSRSLSRSLNCLILCLWQKFLIVDSFSSLFYVWSINKIAKRIKPEHVIRFHHHHHHYHHHHIYSITISWNDASASSFIHSFHWFLFPFFIFSFSHFLILNSRFLFVLYKDNFMENEKNATEKSCDFDTRNSMKKLEKFHESSQKSSFEIFIWKFLMKNSYSEILKWNFL